MSTQTQAQQHPALRTLLSSDETAPAIGVTPATLRVWRCQGKGPRYFKIGNLVRYSLDDINAWLDEQSRSSTPESK